VHPLQSHTSIPQHSKPQILQPILPESCFNNWTTWGLSKNHCRYGQLHLHRSRRIGLLQWVHLESNLLLKICSNPRIPKERFLMPRNFTDSATQLCFSTGHPYDKCIALKILHDQTSTALTSFLCHHIPAPTPYIRHNIHLLSSPWLLVAQQKRKLVATAGKTEVKLLQVHALLFKSIHTVPEYLASLHPLCCLNPLLLHPIYPHPLLSSTSSKVPATCS
jgi:hypothetical protein